MKKNNFSTNLHVLRKQYGMTLEELGNHIHVSKQTLSKYEKGIIDPNLHTLIAIAIVFNCSIDRLIFGNIEKDTSHMDMTIIKNLIDEELNKFEKNLFNNLKKRLLPLLNLENQLTDNVNCELSTLKNNMYNSIENIYKEQLDQLNNTDN